MIFLLDERNVILDAFALLGGNENLVNQVVDRLEESSFRCALWLRQELKKC